MDPLDAIAGQVAELERLRKTQAGRFHFVSGKPGLTGDLYNRAASLEGGLMALANRLKALR